MHDHAAPTKSEAAHRAATAARDAVAANTAGHPLRVLAGLLTGLLLTACDHYPRDAHASSTRAHQAIRVGVSHEPPFVTARPDKPPAGAAVELVERFAAAEGLTIEWVTGGHEPLMRDLREHRLHMVIGGHVDDSPWTDVAWSQRFVVADAQGHPVERRIALPPAENAWQLRVDRFLHTHERTAP